LAGGGAEGKARALALAVAAAVAAGAGPVAQLDGHHPGAGQRGELAGRGAAVLVAIAPEQQPGERGVTRVDAAVVVGVELLQGLEAVLRAGAAAQFGERAEELLARVDAPVAVAVE